MYMRYKKTHDASGVTHYQHEQKISLFHHANGYIPWLVDKKLSGDSKKHESTYKWHIDVVDALNKMGGEYTNTTIVIDLKEHQNKENLSLYEVLNMWGNSDIGWTPIMLHLNPLFIDADPKSTNRDDFKISDENKHDPAYTLLYVKGGVKNGELNGDWMPPGPLNAPVLWHGTFQHFLRGVKEKTPEMLKGV